MRRRVGTRQLKTAIVRLEPAGSDGIQRCPQHFSIPGNRAPLTVRKNAHRGC